MTALAGFRDGYEQVERPALLKGLLTGLRIARPVLPVLLLCAVLHAGLAIWIFSNRSDYFVDSSVSISKDGGGYIRLGRNIFIRGHFSRCSEPPFRPDMFRTPVYPVFVGALDLVGGPVAIYAVQTVLRLATCLLLFLLVRKAFGHRPAFWACLIMSTDPLLTLSAFEPLSETLYSLLLVASLQTLFPVLLNECRHNREGFWRAAAGGCLLGLTTLTRPAALYLPILLAGSAVGSGMIRKNLRASVAVVAILLVTYSAVVGMWIVRNAIVFSVPRVTFTDAVMQAYVVGGGAYQLRHNVTRKEAHRMISKEFGLPPASDAQNPHKKGLKIQDLDAQLRAATPKILAKYPRQLLMSTGIGVVKAAISHPTARLSEIMGNDWVAPGIATFVRRPGDAVHRLLQNGLPLAAFFMWQMLHVGIVLSLTTVGVVWATRNHETRVPAFVLLLLLAYACLTPAMAGVDAETRYRIPMLPFMFAFSGIVAAWLSPRWLFRTTIANDQTSE